MVRILAAVVVVAGCGGTAAEEAGPSSGPALFYAKDGAIYLSDPAGAPARKITEGPGDTDPAPSPDGKRMAYVHKANAEEPGGELRVLDIATGQSRRLVDPAALVPKFDEDRPQATSPRWSPAGDRIAFLKATFGGGGFLLTADADTGAVTAPRTTLFADFDYAWSPDGRQIAWTGGRSDVSPVDVNVYTVGESSTPVVTDTNATSVDFAADRRSVLFTNSDATGNGYTAIPFRLRAGGVYSYLPSQRPAALYSGSGAYADVQALPSGAVAFTEWSADQKTKAITVVENGTPRTVADTPGGAPSPTWTGTDVVAYVAPGSSRALVVKRGGEEPTQIAVGVDAFAWGRV